MNTDKISDKISSIELINSCLEKENPFIKPPFLNARDVWEEDFLDMPTINSHASDTVFKALSEIKSGHYPTASIVITAQDGTGKTHTISRIRHHLQKNDEGLFGLFVYTNQYGDLQKIENSFQQNLAYSLNQIGSKGVTQWQEIATAMTSEAVMRDKSKINTSPKRLLDNFKQRKSETKSVTELTNKFLELKQVSDPDIIRAIFWTLSTSQSLYAIKWLGGEALSEEKAKELNLPSQNQSFAAILQILNIVSEYYELIICFDELDNPSLFDKESGLHISEKITGLIKDLIQNLKKVLILTVVMPDVWQHKVMKLPGGIHQKVCTYGSPLNLKYMNGKDIIDLVSFWLQIYYQKRNLIPPDELYPFTKEQLLHLGQDKNTIREVLVWCKDNCYPPISKESHSTTDTNDSINLKNTNTSADNLLKKVEEYFNNEMRQDFSLVKENKSILADALFYTFNNLIGEKIGTLAIKEISTVNTPNKKTRDHYVDFKIVGEKEGTNFSAGIAILQANGSALSTGLKRLLIYKDFGLTSGYMIRSHDLEITNHNRTKYLEPLIKEGGKYIPFDDQEMKSLVAIKFVFNRIATDYKDIKEEDIKEFMNTNCFLGCNNSLVRKILGLPIKEGE